MLNRQQILDLLHQHLSATTVLHCIEVSAIMAETAKELKQDEEKWSLAGLIHDLDYESIGTDWSKHGTKIKEMIPAEALTPEMWHAVQSHCADYNGIKRENMFDYALVASDNISGLIYATALVYPDKKVASVKAKSIRKRMKEKAFARNVNRDSIMEIEKTGLTIDRFIEAALTAMTKIAPEIGI